MLSFLGGLLIFILVFALIIVLSVLSTIFGTFRRIFSLKKTQPSNEQRHTNSHQSKKIFAKNDGEYVDYEEIKG